MQYIIIYIIYIIYDRNPSNHIQNFDLTCESTVKPLGIDIDYQLNFRETN
jgi:hypothetical protein